MCPVNSLVDGPTVLGSQDIDQLSTVTGLTQVLAFADAVGSFVAPITTACSQLQHLKFKAQTPEQNEVLELPLAGYTYWFQARQLNRIHLQDFIEVGSPLASDEQVHDVHLQVANQTAALLRLAHVLRLQPLLDVLHQFIRHNVWPGGTRMLNGVMGLVFTDTVLEAALGSSTVSKEAYVSSVLAQSCSLTPGQAGYTSLLKPVGPITTDANTNILRFDAQLLRDFAGARAGDTVKVVLDLFGNQLSKDGKGTLMLESASDSDHVAELPVQLLLGCSFPDAAALKAFLTVDPPPW